MDGWMNGIHPPIIPDRTLFRVRRSNPRSSRRCVRPAGRRGVHDAVRANGERTRASTLLPLFYFLFLEAQLLYIYNGAAGSTVDCLRQSSSLPVVRDWSHEGNRRFSESVVPRTVN
eukprot:GHVU01029935.1.p2 GENE.GHVU01029935.1~~GHVU01029935.1.p2  ORF type:complete len:116 (-),score=8.86 GHVU01029935.1:644-991(-)